MEGRVLPVRETAPRLALDRAATGPGGGFGGRSKARSKPANDGYFRVLSRPLRMPTGNSATGWTSRKPAAGFATARCSGTSYRLDEP